MPGKNRRAELAEPRKHVGERMRARRTQLGMTQQDVAGDVFTKAYISALEVGIASPSFSSLVHVAKALKVSPAWLVSRGPVEHTKDYPKLWSDWNMMESGGVLPIPVPEDVDVHTGDIVWLTDSGEKVQAVVLTSRPASAGEGTIALVRPVWDTQDVDDVA